MCMRVVRVSPGTGMPKPRLFYLGYDVPTDSDLDLFEGDFFTGGPQGFLHRPHEAETAGNLHVGNGYTPDRIGLEYPGELFDVERDVVELGTAYYDRFSREEVSMKIGISKGDAIGGD